MSDVVITGRFDAPVERVWRAGLRACPPVPYSSPGYSTRLSVATEHAPSPSRPDAG
jgi:hypothetical protein